MTEAARAAKRAYNREYYSKHKDESRARQVRYWEKKAAEQQAAKVEKDAEK